MHIVWTIAIGFVVALLALMSMSRSSLEGLIVASILGIVGALLGSGFGQLLGMYSADQAARIVMSVVGAFATLMAFKQFSGNSPVTRRYGRKLYSRRRV